ncbi:Integrator complex subunit 1 [Aphelenchoides avenae]|nr:Integrator complex subunit 1 [Aphelenchus avenae]
MSNRPQAKLAAKAKPSHLFALGSKPGDAKSRIQGGMQAVKRPPAATIFSSSGVKKPRLFPSAQGTSGASTSSAAQPGVKPLETDPTWREFPGELAVNAKNFDDLFSAAKTKEKPNKMARVLCAAIRTITGKGDVMADNGFVNSIVKVLQSEGAIQKSTNVLMASMHLLSSLISPPNCPCQKSLIDAMKALLDAAEVWPISLVYYLVNDALESRHWVDTAEAAPILSACVSFIGAPNVPPEALFNACDVPYTTRSISEVASKFDRTEDSVSVATKVILDNFQRRSDVAPTKNLLKTMSMFSATVEVRQLAAAHMDQWLQNGKLQRPAIELLLFVVCNITDASTEANLDVLISLVRLKSLKSKQIMTIFQAALRHLLNNCPGSLSVVLDVILENEFSPAKSQHNAALLHHLFSYSSNETTQLLMANLVKRIDSVESAKAVRVFLRDFVRSSLRTDFAFSTFAKCMIDAMRAHHSRSAANADQLFRGCVEVISMLPLLGVTAAVKDSASVRRGGNSAQVSSAQTESWNKFQQQMKLFWAYALDFLKWAPHMDLKDRVFYVKSYYVLLYLGNYHSYSSLETWPAEGEFHQMTKVIADCPFDESMLKTLLAANVAHQEKSLTTGGKDTHAVKLTPQDILTILDQLTKRCLNVKGFDSEILPVQSVATTDALIKLTAYETNGDNVAAKQLAHKNLYWSAWQLIFIWSCMNKSSLLASAYRKYPTLRLLTYLVVTKDYRFPPVALNGKSGDEVASEDDRERALERKAALAAEGQLTDDTSDDSQSALELHEATCFLKPEGIARKPPDGLCHKLQHYDQAFGIGASLCALREPNILSDVAGDQGPRRLMSSLSELVSDKAGAVQNLPVECLAQLLLHGMQQTSVSAASEDHRPTKPIRLETMSTITNRLKEIALDAKSNLEDVRRLLGFLISKTASPSATERDTVLHALSLLLLDDQHQILSSVLAQLKQTPYFASIRDIVTEGLSKACTVENDFSRVMRYVLFIAENAETDSVHQIASRLSCLVERTGDNTEEHRSVRSVLIAFYADYMRKLASGTLKAPGDTTSSNDALLHVTALQPRVQFEVTGDTVSAIMELLCESFEEDKETGRSNDSREYLMRMWFPAENESRLSVTKAADKSVPVDILPQNLKLKMLSSKDERVVNVVLRPNSTDIAPEQALEFLQSFALTPYSCSRLLDLLRKHETLPISLARAAIPFVRAYKLKGATGVDEFLAKVRRIEESMQTKMEVDEVHTAIQLDPSPSVTSASASKESIAEETTPDFTTEVSVKEFLDHVSSSPSIACNDVTFVASPAWTRLLSAVSNNPELAKAAIVFLNGKEKLQHFIANLPALLSSLLLSLIGLGLKDADIRQRLGILTDRGFPATPEAAFFTSMLQHCRPKQPFAKRPMNAPAKTKPLGDVSQMSADEIVQKLIEAYKTGKSNLTDNQVTQLLKTVTSMRPEIVDVYANDFPRQCRVLFSSTSAPILDLISQLTLRASAATVRKVLATVLDSYDPKLCSSSVLAFVENTVKATNQGHALPSLQQLPALIHYTVQDMTRAETYTDQQDTADRLVAIIDSVVDSGCEKAVGSVKAELKSLYETCELADDQESAKKRAAITALTTAIREKYSADTQSITSGLQGLQRVAEADQQLHRLFVEAFELSTTSKRTPEIEEALAVLWQQVEKNPHLIARHLPLLATHTSSVFQMPTRQARDTECTKYAEFVLKLIRSAAPYSLLDTEPVLAILQSAYEFFDKVHSTKR